MSLPKYFISCDWGTTNFRLRLVETDSLKVLAEHKTDQGIKTLHEKYLGQKKVNQQDFFTDYLAEQIQTLPAPHQKHRIVLAGMASSNIGLKELAYAKLPLDQSGSNLLWTSMVFPNGMDILLISGAKNEEGMMRGEEIQAIGLADHLAPFSKGILLLPGTHSKHLTYDKGKFTELKNFMTGEVFELLSQKSILANSVTSNSWNVDREAAFKEGLQLGWGGKLSSSLFLIRAKHLLKDSKKEDNFYFLSGLLIGDELSYLKQEKDKIFLAAVDPIFSMYQLALEVMLDHQQLVLFDGKALENALLLGQKKILVLYDK